MHEKGLAIPQDEASHATNYVEPGQGYAGDAQGQGQIRRIPNPSGSNVYAGNAGAVADDDDDDGYNSNLGQGSFSGRGRSPGNAGSYAGDLRAANDGGYGKNSLAGNGQASNGGVYTQREPALSSGGNGINTFGRQDRDGQLIEGDGYPQLNRYNGFNGFGGFGGFSQFPQFNNDGFRRFSAFPGFGTQRGFGSFGSPAGSGTFGENQFEPAGYGGQRRYGGLGEYDDERGVGNFY